MHGFPKTEIEYIRSTRSSRLTLKAEHEAELGFRRAPDAHETKVEAELRHTGSHADGWQLFVRTAVLASGTLDTSLSDITAHELAAGVRRTLQVSRSSGSVELRVAHRDRNDGRPDFDRFAIKLKYRLPLRQAWRLDTEMTLNATQPIRSPFRSSGNLRLFVLRPLRVQSALRAGGMVYVDGAVEEGRGAFRFGIGPAIAAFW